MSLCKYYNRIMFDINLRFLNLVICTFILQIFSNIFFVSFVSLLLKTLQNRHDNEENEWERRMKVAFMTKQVSDYNQLSKIGKNEYPSLLSSFYRWRLGNQMSSLATGYALWKLFKIRNFIVGDQYETLKEVFALPIPKSNHVFEWPYHVWNEILYTQIKTHKNYYCIIYYFSARNWMQIVSSIQLIWKARDMLFRSLHIFPHLLLPLAMFALGLCALVCQVLPCYVG